MTKRLVVISAVFTVLAACSSVPEPVPVSTPAPRAEVPAPQPAAPSPVAPVTRDVLPPVQQAFQGPIPGTAEDFLYVSGGEGRVYFDYDQYDLSTGARDMLRRQADWLLRYPQVTAVIEGNADERGTREYNLALGARRADSAKSFLVSLGVAPSRLTTVSYGKERPIDGRSTEDGWARNRNANTNLMSGTIG